MATALTREELERSLSNVKVLEYEEDGKRKTKIFYADDREEWPEITEKQRKELEKLSGIPSEARELSDRLTGLPQRRVVDLVEFARLIAGAQIQITPDEVKDIINFGTTCTDLRIRMASTLAETILRLSVVDEGFKRSGSMSFIIDEYFILSELVERFSNLLFSSANDSRIKRGRAFLSRIKEKLPPQARKVHDEFLFESTFPDVRLNVYHHSLKRSRFESLLPISPLSAVRYSSGFVVGDDDLIDAIAPYLKESGGESNSSEIIYGVMQMHSALYSAITKRFKVKPREKPRSKVFIPEIKPTEPAKELTLQDKIELAIIGSNPNGLFSQDMVMRTKYFAHEDVPRYLAPEQIPALIEILERARITRKMKRGVEMTDMRYRNFLDDVNIRFLSQGRLPTEREIDALYAKID